MQAEMCAFECWLPMQLALNRLDLLDVFRLSITSKGAQTCCIEQLSEGDCGLARGLLYRTVRALSDLVHGSGEHATTTQLQLQLLGAVGWLLGSRVMPPDVLALDSGRFVAIPGISSVVREQLVAAGLLVVYDDLVSAAKQQVEDLHEWIEACEEQDVQLNLLQTTKAVCCADEELDAEYLNSSADTLLDHLYLALNSVGTCNPVADSTACKNISRLCSLPVSDDLSTEAVASLLQAAVEIFSTRKCNTQSHVKQNAFGSLCSLRAAADVPAAQLSMMLKTSVRNNLDKNQSRQLLALDGAKQLSTDQAIELLQLCGATVTALTESNQSSGNIACHPTSVFDVLLSLPAAQGFSPQQCVNLYKYFLESGRANIHVCWLFMHCLMYTLISNVNGYNTAGVIVQLIDMVLATFADSPHEDLVSSYLAQPYTLPAAANITRQQLEPLLQRTHEMRVGEKARSVLYKLLDKIQAEVAQ